MTRVSRCLLVMALASSACGDDEGPTFKPPMTLPILPGYNHSSETSVAARDGAVVVLKIDQEYNSADTFEFTTLPRRIAAHISTDGGESFEPVVAPNSVYDVLTDPVVIVAADGTFWASGITGTENEGKIWRWRPTEDWTEVVGDLGIKDKEWIAASPDGGTLYAGGVRLYTKYSASGELLGSATTELENPNAVTAYATDEAGYFVIMDGEILRFDGVTLSMEGPSLDYGDLAQATMTRPDDIWTRAAASAGLIGDSTEWIVHNRWSSTGGRRVVLRLRELGQDATLEQNVSPPEQNAFLPAAAMGSDGRLHVVWYDSADLYGVLRYTHSKSADFSEGFEPSIVIDPDACPGSGWNPHRSSEDPPGGRRLREYIGIAVDGNRAYISWTHAPIPPSVVMTTYVRFH